MKYVSTPLILTEKVNMLLSNTVLPATLTIEQCALEFAMSTTSFRRKLSQEETTYKLIQQKFLNELCVDALLKHHIKIDDLSIKLGYSERATFERAFRLKFGITPAQFRKLSLINSPGNSQHNLTQLAQNLPPMSGSCAQLLREKNQESLDIQRVVDIIEKDPIFSVRIMGLASKAIYGKTPHTLNEAVGRNLGVNFVVNLAVIYAVKDALQAHIEAVVIEQYTQTFLLAPKFFHIIRKETKGRIKFNIGLTEQMVTFALIGIFLLSHKRVAQHELVLHSLQGVDDLFSLNRQLKALLSISLFSASSLMLSLWNIDVELVKQLNHIDKVSQNNTKTNMQDEITKFMLSCLYMSATMQQDVSALEEKAALLTLSNFSDIKALLFPYL